MSRDALVITGPTASGKTALSIAVAQRLQGEIISMDSRQVYRGMDIGTAKATPQERALVPHHGLDLVDPDTRYSAGRFARDARATLAEIRARGHTPILVGGTGFFLRALTHPLFEEPPLGTDRRAVLHELLQGWDDAELLRWLDRLDPESAARFRSAGGRQRIQRALEVVLLSGHPISWWQRETGSAEAPLHPLVFVLDLPRSELYRRINERVRGMIAAGFVAEVQQLLARGYSPAAPGMTATGYPEISAYLRGETTLDAAIDAIQRATRRYARRQETWFRHQLPADVIRLDAARGVDDLCEEVVRRWAEEVGSANRN